MSKLELAYIDDLTLKDVVDAIKENGDLEIVQESVYANRAVIQAVSKSTAGLGDVLNIQLIIRRTNLTCVITHETKLAGLYKGNIEGFLKKIVCSRQ